MSQKKLSFELSYDEFTRISGTYRKEQKRFQPTENGECKGPVEPGRGMSEIGSVEKNGTRQMCLSGPTLAMWGLDQGSATIFSEGPGRKDLMSFSQMAGLVIKENKNRHKNVISEAGEMAR